jgi:hypothetical protein
MFPVRTILMCVACSCEDPSNTIFILQDAASVKILVDRCRNLRQLKTSTRGAEYFRALSMKRPVPVILKWFPVVWKKNLWTPVLVLLSVTPFWLVDWSISKDDDFLFFKVGQVVDLDGLILRIKTLPTFETSVIIYQLTRRNVLN